MSEEIFLFIKLRKSNFIFIIAGVSSIILSIDEKIEITSLSSLVIQLARYSSEIMNSSSNMNIQEISIADIMISEVIIDVLRII